MRYRSSPICFDLFAASETQQNKQVLLRWGGDELGSYCLSCQLLVNRKGNSGHHENGVRYFCSISS